MCVLTSIARLGHLFQSHTVIVHLSKSLEASSMVNIITSDRLQPFRYLEADSVSMTIEEEQEQVSV